MKIIETNIISINNNIDNAKIDLSNKIISKIKPLLSELDNERHSDLINKKKEYNKTKQNITNKKLNLEEKIKQLNKKRKTKNLLNRISKLIESGLVYEGSLKSEFIILIKTIDLIDEKTLNRHLNETMNLISKRFSKKL